MTKSIKQLNDNLIALDGRVQDLAQNLQLLYQDYLPHLITVVKRQLMIATYQICTQKYPEAFLRLTYSQRTKLQDKIKGLARDFSHKLVESYQEIELPDNALIKDLHHQIVAIVSSENNIPTLTAEKKENQEHLSAEVTKQTNELTTIDSCTLQLPPEELIQLQFDLDDSLDDCLIHLSHSANNCLQEVNVLSKKIPNQILAIALQAEENTSIVSGAPNLLSILIQKEPKSDEDLEVNPVIAICLRINDLEFHDSKLNLSKQKINKILSQLNNLNEQYEELHQEYLVAQAEAAWRASWYED